MRAEELLQVPHVEKYDGTIIPTSTLNGKYLMLYFSASWCPPCQQFTPLLGKYYSFLPKDKAEILFVSMDNDEKSFRSYFSKMPWPAMPYSYRAHKEMLCNVFGVKTIPALVFLNGKGEMVTKHGRWVVPMDPMAKGFPYTAEAVQGYIDMSQSQKAMCAIM
eukprot:PhF_6_TR10180/c0_g1_i1/m.15786/K17609/NXN; nucleoredoxin